MFDLATTLPVSSLGSLKLSRVEEHFLRTALVTIACVLCFKIIYSFEVNVLLNDVRAARFVGEASEAAMRYVGLPHIFIGFLFLVTSRSNQVTRARVSILGLLAVGVMLCAAYGLAGGKS